MVKKGCKPTEEHIHKIAQANRGKHRTEEQKQAISRALKESWTNWPLTLTAEHIHKISKALKGRQSSLKGKKLTEEHKRKMSLERKGMLGEWVTSLSITILQIKLLVPSTHLVSFALMTKNSHISLFHMNIFYHFYKRIIQLLIMKKDLG